MFFIFSSSFLLKKYNQSPFYRIWSFQGSCSALSLVSLKCNYFVFCYVRLGLEVNLIIFCLYIEGRVWELCLKSRKGNEPLQTLNEFFSCVKNYSISLCPTGRVADIPTGFRMILRLSNVTLNLICKGIFVLLIFNFWNMIKSLWNL